MKTKILIPYASYGNGHKAIADYIKNYFEAKNNDYEIMTIDLLKYSIPIIGSVSSKISSCLMLKFPVIWSAIYSLFDHKISGSVGSSLTFTMFKNRKLKKCILDFNPDLTISTHFFGSSLIAHYSKKGLCHSKLITIVTDYETHEFWLKNHKVEDAIIVGNKEEAVEIAKRGIDIKKIKPLGIPVAPIVPTDFDKNKALKKYGFKGNRPVCLFFAGGGAGKSASLPYIKRLIKSKLNIDFLLVAGKNSANESKVRKLVKEYNADNFKVFGFVTNVPELFQLCDFVITKPGGAQSTESLYFKKPIILINGNGGQENANCRYFVKNGYAKKFSFSFTFIKYLKEINEKPHTLNVIRENMQKNTNDKAMEELYKLVHEVLNS